ncbi:concanavalin A-like lectin/glucanase domain-containing protein [Collybia nuda]|uniref:Concanavalin A-like lectin/glucanase domain-containing protein n=1 Tax=Collybia nuda TaxID=64659 RepID=A0A9P5Y236_9AGAR|nr:concanavalin A-like lectin/glucanase domain-containing protein [Collybia nuda]
MTSAHSSRASLGPLSLVSDILNDLKPPSIEFEPPDGIPGPQQPDALLVLLPLLIVLSTFLFLLLIFLICVLLVRRRRGISLNDHDGPIDMSREELIEGEGGFEGVESRWLEGVDESIRRAYFRAKEHQVQYPPNSLPTDITLSQFLSIQEKGVSAWSFEPDYETVNSLIVHARTEITFLPDPASSSCVQSNLPLPKLNEVYYWEVKMFDLPEATTVAVGLATKPYPAFRLPGLNRYSVAYHSNGDKSHNYPFTMSPFGPSLKEGDVLGVGYRPRTGTVFYTRNGRKMEDAFVGLSRWNLFPTIGADGPCSVHVNLGQAGFVFIEANVKKWGLAPSVGTLAPPPAYGSERGSILLDVGGRVRTSIDGTPQSTSTSPASRRSHRSRRPKPPGAPVGSPLRTTYLSAPSPLTPPPPITPIDEESEDGSNPGPSTSRYFDGSPPEGYHSLQRTPPNNDEELIEDAETASAPSSPTISSRSLSPDNSGTRNPFTAHRRQRHSLTHFATSLSESGAELTVQIHPPPDSPMSPILNPPTPNHRDIHLQALSRPGTNGAHRRAGSSGSTHESNSSDDHLPSVGRLTRRDPPAYSPLDAFTYADGVHIDLPAEVIAAALEGNTVPASSIGQTNVSRPDRRSRRR